MSEEIKTIIQLMDEHHKIMVENAKMKAALEYLKEDYIHDRKKGYAHDEVRIALELIAGIKIPDMEDENE